jgi:muconate cycloisomerase
MPIAAVTAAPIDGRVRPELAIVSSLGAHVVGQYVLVRVVDDEGRVGLGEASVTAVWSGETQAGCLALVRDVLAPRLVGADPFDSEWLCRAMERAAFGNSFARAAVEMALLDLQGRILGVPVYHLLGGRGERRALRLKFVVGAVEPEAAAERARQMTQAGRTAIKVKVGRDVAADVARLSVVRDAVGPEVLLTVDANGGYDRRDAVQAAQAFEALGVALFEQPTRRGDHEAMAWVRRRSGVPIMADESCFTAQDVLAILKADAADVLSLYPGKHGGVRATQRLAQMAEAAGVACTIGSNLEREVATAAMAHAAAATANIDCERYPGDLIGPLYFEGPLTAAPLAYAADRLRVPEGPGLGVELPGGAGS